MSEPLATRNEPIDSCGKLVAACGFAPNLFGAQSELPRAIVAEEGLIEAIVVRESALTRPQKERLLQELATDWGNPDCLAHYGQSTPIVSARESGLLKFARKLARRAPWFSGNDVDALKEAGFDEKAILEAVIIIALGRMLCTLADGLCRAPDAGDSAVAAPLEDLPASFDGVETAGPYLQLQPRLADDFQPYAALREQFGFVPNLFRAQSLRPDLLEAEVEAVRAILFPEDHLSFVQKENILLVIAAANLNTYSVAVHIQILNALGVPLEESDQIVEDHHGAALSSADMALLDEVRKLASPPSRPEVHFETEILRTHGFTEAQIVEAVAMSGLTNFLNTLQTGLGAVPDFPPRRVFTPKDLYPSAVQPRPISDAATIDDPDAALVVRVQNGDVDVFEELVRRHTRRVFGVLVGIVGNMDDVRDATQEVFLKAFEHIDRFQGRSKFSTWLMSIAINTGTELVRRRKPSERLDELEEDEGFRPRQIQTWAENPEQVLATAQIRDLVREGILRLPQKYRIVVLLRDINQLSTEEAATALGLGVPALKARLLRGRLMLRESLAPHFTRPEKSPDAQLR